MGGQHQASDGRTRTRLTAVGAAGVAVVVVGVLPGATARAASPPVQQAKLTAGDAASGNYFGYQVALSGDRNTALLGALGHNASAGAAYVFTRSGSTWTQRAELTASDGASNDEFGFSVALDEDGDTALVGAPAKPGGGSTGAVYVFAGGGASWTQQAELTAGDGASGDSFGYAVAVRGGNIALISAPFKNSSTGAAYIFTSTGSAWTQRAELIASDGASPDEFGRSVAFGGNIALIGAPFKNSFAGAVYVFTGSGASWTQQTELAAGDGVSGAEFGYSVALGSGNTALIGAPFKNSNAGEAYVFTGSGSIWTQRAEFTGSDVASNDEFGFSVAYGGGSTAIVGAPFKNSATGAAYIFTGPKVYPQLAKLTASDGAAGDGFGWSMALDLTGKTAVIGAPLQPGFSNVGAGYVFVR